MASCLHRALARCRAHLIREDDCEATRARKYASLVLAFVGLFGHQHWLAYDGSRGWMYGFWSAYDIVLSCAVAFYVLFRGRMTESMYVAILALYCILVLGLDIVSLSVGGSTVSYLFIVVLDLLLVGRVGSRESMVFYYTIVVYHIVIMFEVAYRFGIFDMPGLATPEQRRAYNLDCSDDELPCARGMRTAFIRITPMTVVFTLDFWLTRRYAVNLHRERDAMSAAVQTAQAIASSLALFDLDDAEARLHDSDLPEDLHDALSCILENLHNYRPFLPHILFEKLDEIRRDSPLPLTPAGLRQRDLLVDARRQNIPGVQPPHHVAMVFTDIRQSTALWEHSPNAMKDALALHNTVIRTRISASEGYEVKTIGDAFMIAYHAAVDAVQCALDVQERFTRDEVWPAALSRGDTTDGFPVFSVRIGIHCGPACVEKNVLTNRYDYFGSTVNKAARVESLGIPMAVTVTPEIMAAVAHTLEGVIVVPYACSLAARGLQNKLQLTALLPASLEEKKEFVQQSANHEALARHDATARWRRSASMQHCPRDDASEVHERVVELESVYTAEELPSSAALEMMNKSITSLASDSIMLRRQDTMTSVLRGRNSREMHTGSIALVKLGLWEPDANGNAVPADTEARLSHHLSLVHMHLASTHGILSAVLNNTVLVSWGVHRPCTQYVAKSVRFLTLLHESQMHLESAPTRVRSNDTATKRSNVSVAPSSCNDGYFPFTAGLVTGPMESGCLVASLSQQFITVLGPCVDVASMLCAAAVELGTCALVTSLAERGEDQYDTDPVVAQYVRPVDEWSGSVCARMKGFGAWNGWREKAGVIGVLELRLPQLLSALQNPEHDASDIDPDDTNARYSIAYSARDIEALREMGCSDPVVMRVCRMLETQTHLQHSYLGLLPPPAQEKDNTD